MNRGGSKGGGGQCGQLPLGDFALKNLALKRREFPKSFSRGRNPRTPTREHNSQFAFLCGIATKTCDSSIFVVFLDTFFFCNSQILNNVVIGYTVEEISP